MRIFIFLFAACAMQAQSTLPDLIAAAQNNERIQSYVLENKAQSIGIESVKRSYFPRIDAFGSAAYVDHMGGFDAKQSYIGGVKGELILFDGFKRENLLNQSKALEKASKHQLEAAKKEIALEVIQRYFEYQNVVDEIETLSAMRDQLQAQLIRLEKFKTAGLASDDALMRMKSEVFDADYRIEDLRYQSERQKSELEKICGRPVSPLANAYVISPQNEIAAKELDKVAVMRYTRDAKMHEAHQKDASTLPTIKIEDQLSYYDYYNDPIANMRVDTQNKLTASLTMTLFDFSTASLAKQALMTQAQAQSSNLAYALKEADQNLMISRRYVERSRILIESSQSAHDASAATFEAVKKKYEARIVDYVTYLDALHTLTDATNRFNRAKRTLYHAYASYYFYAGFDPGEFVR